MTAPRDLVAEARTMADTAGNYMTDTGILLTDLAEEIERLRNRLAGAAEIAEGHRLLIAEGEKQATERPVMSALFGDDFPCCTTDPKDTAVSHADEPQPPMPAEGAPHAWIAVRRQHSVNADRPEWGPDAAVIPEWNADDINFARSQGYTLIPIGPDGDTGTRAIVEPVALPMSKGGLYVRENGAKVRLIGPAYEHRDLRKYCLSLAALASELWVGDLTSPNGNGHVEPCLVTGENLAALGYTLVTEHPACTTCGGVQVHGTTYRECECP